ncbi:MAG: transposase [Planctomycetota bacterium]|nr:transposase [Planctomycetota bacterium]
MYHASGFAVKIDWKRLRTSRGKCDWGRFPKSLELMIPEDYQVLEKFAKNDYRMHGAETPCADIKHVLVIGQFLLRGLKKVKLEWLWARLANNVWKLVRDIRSLRAQQKVEMAKMKSE